MESKNFQYFFNAGVKNERSCDMNSRGGRKSLMRIIHPISSVFTISESYLSPIDSYYYHPRRE